MIEARHRISGLLLYAPEQVREEVLRKLEHQGVIDRLTHDGLLIVENKIAETPQTVISPQGIEWLLGAL